LDSNQISNFLQEHFLSIEAVAIRGPYFWITSDGYCTAAMRTMIAPAKTLYLPF